MAIVDMKRLLLVGLRDDKPALIKYLQRAGCVQVSAFDEAPELAASEAAPMLSPEQTQQKLDRLRWAITRLGKYDHSKVSMLSAKPAATLEQLDPSPEEATAQEELVSHLETIESRIGSLRGQQTQLHNQIEQLSPWQGLDIPLEQLRDQPQLKQYLGSLPKAALERLESDWAGQPVVIESLGEQRDSLSIWAAAHSSQAQAFAQALQQAGFSAANLPFREGTVRQHLAQTQQDLDSLARDQQGIEDEMKALVPRLPALKVYFDAVANQLARAQAHEQTIDTRSSFLLRGWLPAPLEDKLTAELKQRFPSTLVQISEPAEGEEPPVLLHNNRFATPFESVVEGFSLPQYGSLDPTAVMAPFFACFFGMMVSDAGYGLMMMILIPLLLHLMKPSKAGRKLFLLIGIGGVFTVFWGFIYNTWFGFAPMKNAIMDAVNRPLEVMVLCIAVGALHLLAGLVMGAVQHIRRGEYIDVMYDQVSWLMLLVGLGLLAVPGLGEIGKWLALAGAGIVLVFAGRDKSRNPFKRLMSGLGALYGISSWLSDLLSYLRLFGMGLATGVIGMVFNILIGMVFQIGPIGWVIGAVLFVGCHAFNAGINILGAYVHASRLQYIEFFGKFYEEGGSPFKPLHHAPRFVRISDA